MNLEEIRKIVAFMKETGVSELTYTGKGSSISLKLAPPAPSKGGKRPGKDRKGVSELEENPFALEPSGVEVEFSDDDEPEAINSEELKKMAKAAKRAAKEAAREAKETAKEAAKEAREAAKEAARAAKAAIKSYQEEYEGPDSDEEDEDELFDLDTPIEVALEGVEEPEEDKADSNIDLDTEALKENAKQAAAKVTDAAITTAKIGVQLGKQGLQYLKDKRDELLAKSEQGTPAEGAEAPEEPTEITLEEQDKEE